MCIFQNRETRRKKLLAKRLLDKMDVNDFKFLLDVMRSNAIKKVIETEKKIARDKFNREIEEWENAVERYHQKMIKQGVPYELWEV